MISILLSIIISGFIFKYFYKSIKTAPIKYTDEKRFIEAVRCEERFSRILENDFETPLKHSNDNYL
jgi:hypothetical protein